MELIERECLAHFIDANFNPDPDNLGTGKTLNYVRIGEDLEAYATELNPQVEVRKNILGAQKVIHNGYETQSSADTFYCYRDEPLYEQLEKIANERLHGTDCQTSRIEAMFTINPEDSTAVCQWAYRENCWVVPSTFGGDTSGVQIPFTVFDCGSRVKGTLAKNQSDKWVFTANT